MIVHVLKFQAKPGKEKTVHKIIRNSMLVLKKHGHKGLSYHSFRDTTDKSQFIHINIFNTEEAEARYENSRELRDYFERLQSVINGRIDYHVVESFEFFQARD